jgi:hypothetical protein
MPKSNFDEYKTLLACACLSQKVLPQDPGTDDEALKRTPKAKAKPKVELLEDMRGNSESLTIAVLLKSACIYKGILQFIKGL